MLKLFPELKLPPICLLHSPSLSQARHTSTACCLLVATISCLAAPIEIEIHQHYIGHFLTQSSKGQGVNGEWIFVFLDLCFSGESEGKSLPQACQIGSKTISHMLHPSFLPRTKMIFVMLLQKVLCFFLERDQVLAAHQPTVKIQQRGPNYLL